MARDLNTASDAAAMLETAWPAIVTECRAVLGGELHYQAIVYHCLRMAGCPPNQVGMNVKQWVRAPATDLFRAWADKKHIDYREGFETIPDVVLFSPDVAGDWRRRNYERTLGCMLAAVEVKASERASNRLSTREIIRDIDKLAAHRDEVSQLGCSMLPVMMVIDVAPLTAERMVAASVDACRSHAATTNVGWAYATIDGDECAL